MRQESRDRGLSNQREHAHKKHLSQGRFQADPVTSLPEKPGRMSWYDIILIALMVIQVVVSVAVIVFQVVATAGAATPAAAAETFELIELVGAEEGALELGSEEFAETVPLLVKKGL